MRVALADDSVLFRQGLAALLAAAGMEVTAQAPTGADLLASIADDPPDVAVLDIRMPPTFTDEGLLAADELRRRHPEVGVLVLSTYAEPQYAVRLLGAGRSGVGYLLKDRVDDVPTLCDALHRLCAGEAVVDEDLVQRLLNRPRTTTGLDALTDREQEVLRLMAEGRSNAGIAGALFVSAKTVETHVARIFLKLGLEPTEDDNRRVVAVLRWLRGG